MEKTQYRLKLEDKYLAFQEHGDYTQIFTLCSHEEDAAVFATEEDAISAICDAFYFHHGCGSILEKDSAKDRLAKIVIVKQTITIIDEEIKPQLYIPTNIEIHQWYCANGDHGLAIYLKSQTPNWKDVGCYLAHTFYDDDGYEFASSSSRILGYNKWVADGKPRKPTKAEIIKKAIAERDKKND